MHTITFTPEQLLDLISRARSRDAKMFNNAETKIQGRSDKKKEAEKELIEDAIIDNE